MELQTRRQDRFPHHSEAIVHDVARERITEQLARIDSIDNKAGVLFGLASAIITAAVAVVTLGLPSTPVVALLCLISGGVFYLATAAILLKVLAPREWSAGPKLDKLWTFAFDYSDIEMKWWVAEQYSTAYAENEANLIRKADHLGWAFKLVFCETTAVVLGLIITIVSR